MEIAVSLKVLPYFIAHPFPTFNSRSRPGKNSAITSLLKSFEFPDGSRADVRSRLDSYHNSLPFVTKDQKQVN